MVYSNWNNELIDRQLKKVKYLYKKNPSESLLTDIESLKLIKNKIINPFPEKSSFKEQMNSNIASLYEYEDFLEDIKSFSQMKSSLEAYLISFSDKFDNPIEAILGFTHDFYNNLDKDFATAFNKIYKARKNNLMFSDKRSITVTINSLNYSYLNVKRQNTIEDYFYSIHEYGHAITDLIFYRYCYCYKYPFTELVPLFMELIAADEINDTFFDLDKDIASYKAIALYTVLDYSREISLFYSFIAHCDKYPYNKSQMQLNLAKYANISENNANKILTMSNLERFSYTIPYLVAIELYYLYRVDKEKALYYLKELIKLPMCDNYQVPLLDRDIILNNNSKKYILEINNELRAFK